MLTKTVTYEDFNNVTQTEYLYFNLSKTEMVDLLDMQPRLEAWASKTAGEERDLTPEEIRELLDIVKEIIKASYGKRSEDGRRFSKSDEIFRDFKESAAYDEFLFGLFKDSDAAFEFLMGVMPKGLADDAIEAANKQKAQIDGSTPSINTAETEVPLYMREGREATSTELRAMTQPELIAAYEYKNRLVQQASQ